MPRHASKASPSTQKYLEIAEIKEDTVVLKDGTLRAVILVSSINFALKGELEQQSLISAYMDFINSFDYEFQIVIQSRNINLDNYLNSLTGLIEGQKNDQLKAQMISYRNYLSQLLDSNDIMTKKFFVVIPYSALKSERKTFFNKLKDLFTPGIVLKLSKDSFEKYKREIDIRAGQVMGQLESMGLKATRLDTQSLIEMYYSVYNPGTAQNQKMTDVNDLLVEQTF